jgi:hypothetical protein
MTVADTAEFAGETPVDGLSVPPGAELAGVLESLIPFVLDDGELVDALVAFRRLTSWAQAGELAVIAELGRRRPSGAYERLANGSSSTGEFLVDEVEAAPTLTGNSAAYLVELALTLDERLPATLEALRAGLIDHAKAKVIAQGTSAVTTQIAGRVERQVLDSAPEQTTSQLRARVARAVIAADPDAADKRRKAAEAQRDVACHEERDGSGTATLTGRHLPADQAVAAANRLNAIARAFKADGDTRRLGAIRADVMLALLLGLLPTDLQTQAQTQTQTQAPPETTPIGDRLQGAHGPVPGDAPPHPLPQTTPGRNQCEHNPVPIVGDAPPPEGPDDDLVDGTDLPDSQDPQVQPWYDTPGENDQDAYDAPAFRGAQLAARAGARIGTVNLTIPLTTFLGLGDQPADIPGYGPVLAEVARILADNATRPGSEWCITILDDDGKPIQHGETGYRPSPGLRRKVESRNPTCVFPQCRRPARACDLDHTTPFGHGDGITCGCNLAPLCRRHHRVKQAEGWRLDEIQPGHYLWTTPCGKRYHSAPEEQPL